MIQWCHISNKGKGVRMARSPAGKRYSDQLAVDYRTSSNASRPHAVTVRTQNESKWYIHPPSHPKLGSEKWRALRLNLCAPILRSGRVRAVTHR
jgi:hypothetical protein